MSARRSAQARARATFLDDQRAGAAATIDAHLARRQATDVGATWTDPRHPVVQGLLGLLEDRLRAGDIEPCQHIDRSAPAPTFWIPALPDMLRCQLCTVAAGGVLHLQHQRGDLGCDLCGATDRPLESARVRVRATFILATVCLGCLNPDGAR